MGRISDHFKRVWRETMGWHEQNRNQYQADTKVDSLNTRGRQEGEIETTYGGITSSARKLTSEEDETLLGLHHELMRFRQRASRRSLHFFSDAFPDLPYDFSSVPFINWAGGKLYLFDGRNAVQALNDILSMNRFLIDASRAVPKMAGTRISTVRFVPTPRQSFGDFTSFSLNPFTETDRKSKYPMIIDFDTTEAARKYDAYRNDVFGKIFYLASGAIGRAEIIVWQNGGVWTVYCTLDKCNEMKVSRIVEASTGRRKTIFNA